MEEVINFFDKYEFLFTIMSGCHDPGNLINDEDYFGYNFSKNQIYQLFFYGESTYFEAIKADSDLESCAVFEIDFEDCHKYKSIKSSVSFRSFVTDKLKLFRKMIKLKIKNPNNNDRYELEKKFNKKYNVNLEMYHLDFTWLVDEDDPIDLQDILSDIDEALVELKKFPLNVNEQKLNCKDA
jgi:hypothetical protein